MEKKKRICVEPIKIGFLPLFFKIFALCLVFLVLYCKPSHDTSINVKKGTVDLRSLDLSKEVVLLKGKWEFYPNALMVQEPTSVRPDHITVPGNWLQSKQQEKYGVATYRLKILIAPSSFEPITSLLIEEVGTAYKLYLNRKLIYENGVVGKSQKEMVTSYKRALVPINFSNNELEIALEVSNFYHPFGGIKNNVYIGSYYKLLKSERNKTALDLFLFGSTFLMGLYHVALFLIRKKDSSPLWFGLFAITIGIRTLFTESVFIYQNAPNELWIYLHKIEVICYALLPLFMILFLKNVFPKEFLKFSIYFGLFHSISFSIIAILFNSTVYMSIIRYYHLSTVAIIVYLFYVVFWTLYRKREGSTMFFIGFLVLSTTSINDMLNQSSLIYTGFILPWGLLVFIFIQTTMLSIKFSKAFLQVENLTQKLYEQTHQLQHTNEELLNFQKNLEDKVKERTYELQEATKKAEEANKLKDSFLSLVSHDLRSPIAGTIGALQLAMEDFSEMSSEELLAFITEAKVSSERSLHLIEELLDLHRFKSGMFEPKISKVHLESEFENVIAKTYQQAKEKNIKVRYPVQAETYVYADQHLIGEVIYNLITNAIKFSYPNNTIDISVSYIHGYIQISVQDRGVGIPESVMQNLFNMAVKTTTLGTAGELGTGLGLPLVKQILEAHDGDIYVESELEKGSKFTVSLPHHF